MLFYRALGFDLASEIPLPGLAEAAETGGRPPISLLVGKVPQSLQNPVVKRPLIEIGADRVCLFSVPGLARYLIADDRSIVVNPAPDAPIDRVVAHLCLTPMAVLCYRHGLLPLAASAARVEGEAIMIGGGPATGKTVLSMGLAQRGHAFMADSLCALEAFGPHGPRLWPAWPRAGLWPDCLGALAPEVEVRPLFAGGRVPVTPPGPFSCDAAPVRGIVSRSRANGIAPRAQRLRGHRAVQRLSALMWMDDLGRYLATPAVFHAALTHCAATIPLFEHTYPDGFDGLEAELDIVLGLFSPA
jgi:hypothetical protein